MVENLTLKRGGSVKKCKNLGGKFPIRLEYLPPHDEDDFEFQNYFLIKNK